MEYKFGKGRQSKTVKRDRVRRQNRMRNILSSILAVIAGAILIVLLLELAQPAYPEPFSLIWILLLGSSTLQNTFSFILNPSVMFLYLVSWIAIGLIIGPFSKAGWNTVRSTLWVGLILAILALASLLLLDPTFWGLPSRNFDLLYQFATSMFVSLIALPSALLTAMLTRKILKKSDPPVPTKIETICECGAVFKSKPMICAECGRRLTN
ncbi:MAG: hypothetical protein ACW98U_00770 [Candidatus Thorarchaeota archaeon]|jgi:hypothetical protein